MVWVLNIHTIGGRLHKPCTASIKTTTDKNMGQI